MSMQVRSFLQVFLIFVGLFASVNAMAGVDVFISNVPVQREAVPPPGGSMNCYMAPSGYYNGIWINEHRICEYDNSPYGAVWVAGFWQCVNFSRHGVCRQWYWQRSHWVRQGVVEYGVVWHGRPGGHGPRYYKGYDNGYGPRYRDHNW